MRITEIFRSIQGESTHAGLPCVFVRTTGCNLRCVWCDTAYAFHGGSEMSVEEVLARVAELSGQAPGGQSELPVVRTVTPPAMNLVELTGGEPLLQQEIAPLAERLLAAGYTVLIETSGERFVGALPREVVKIVDVKCPDSGEFGTFHMDNLKVLDGKDEVKFVIGSRRDYEFARDFLEHHDLTQQVRQVNFSPVFADPAGSWPGLDARLLAEWVLEDRLAVRLGLQLHKFIWDPAAKGV